MTERELFQSAFNGNDDACSFCLSILFIAHLWDDLIDKDKNRSDGEINTAFETMLLTIPANPFYQQYGGAIRPMLHTAILAWHESNIRQKGNENDRFYAYFLRNSLLNVVLFACLVSGGNVATLHDYFAMTMKDKYDEFLKEGNHA